MKKLNKEQEKYIEQQKELKKIQSDTNAELMRDIATLKSFNGTKEQEIELCKQMNTKYGEAMGYYKTVSQWYNALVKNSKLYCQQMVLEARIRSLASQAAEAEQMKDAQIAEATQRKEAQIAEYQADRRTKAAEANKKASVAEQTATIDVAKAKAEAGKAEAEADRVTGIAKVEARMSVAKAEQEKQIEVNQMAAKAKEAELHATTVVPAIKQKEQATIQAEQTKAVATLEAEAQAAKILKEAEAQAEAVRIQKLAEAEGEKQILLAQAEGKRASLMAEAEQQQQIALAPALAFKQMVETAGGNPDVVVQYMMTDKWQEIVGAQVKALEHINLGNVTVYGDANTGAQFMQNMIKNFAPMVDMVNSGLKGKVKELFGKDVNDTKAITDTKEVDNHSDTTVNNSTEKTPKVKVKDVKFTDVK